MRVLAIVLFLSMLSIVCAEDWPQWRGAYGDGISRESGLLQKWPEEGPQKLWEIDLGEGFSGISIVGDIAVTLYGDAPGGTKKPKPENAPAKKFHNGYNFDVPIEQQELDKYEYAVAININSGKILWKKNLNELYYNQMGNGPRSTPAINDGRVYLVSGQANLLCLDLKTGKQLWAVNLLQQFQSDNMLFGISSSPIVYKNLVIYQVAPGENSIVAFDKKTGKVVWKIAGEGPSYATPLLVNSFEKEQILFFDRYGIQGIDPATQQRLWQEPWQTFEQIHAAAPIFYNNHVYISSGYHTGAGLVKLEKKDDKITSNFVWKTPQMKNHFSSSVRIGDYVYGFHNHILKCIDFYKADTKWQARGFGKGTLVATENRLFVLGESGEVALVEVNPSKYKVRGKFSPFAEKTVCWTTPSISQGCLFIRDKRKLMCFSIK